ncbi:MAG TPA: glycosyltransferase family 2 protein, partial [Actinopolymorphaceae bacterium]|nr:glycosyltransferase family 2 protein [Actinopolymorphaceae bacterium]
MSYTETRSTEPLLARGQVRLGAVIVTMGDRPAELAALLESVRTQEGPPLPVVVVGNGTRLTGLPDG